MKASEAPFVFDCEGQPLLGILHRAHDAMRCGVIIVVGGPQYRVGSHRQFVLLARALAEAGIPVLRFDYRGMGDSGGEFRGFEHIDADIAAAIGAFSERCPTVDKIVLWGLCDAASAALFYAYKDPRICGLVMINPWVRTAAGEAKAYLRHYYRARLADPDFWRKIVAGRFSVGASMRSFADLLRTALARRGPSTRPRRDGPENNAALALPERMARCLGRFDGPVLLLMSGNDLTAREFDDAAAASPLWRQLLGLPRITRKDLREADHTFSRRAWRNQVSDWTIAWIRQNWQ